MPRQFEYRPKHSDSESEETYEDKMKRFLKDNYGKNPEAEAELGRPVSKLEVMLLLEDILRDMSAIYALIDLLVEKGIVTKTEISNMFEYSRKHFENI